tara:strand:+ start:936 stop:1676 length:741 start_codon:yes stop_codon:yes gene_type:complete
MAVTAIKGPTAGAAIGTGIGDGNNYAGASSGIRQRIFETQTGTNAYAHVATSTSTEGDVFTGFNFGLTDEGTYEILGLEIVAGTDFDGSGNSYMGSFGSSSGTGIIRCYFYNGTAFSSALEWDSSALVSGIALSDSDTTATFTGGNKRYINTTSGDDVLFGANDTLSGLAWDVDDQDDWGFAFTFQQTSGTFVAGVLRGVGIRVTYSLDTDPVDSVIINPLTYNNQINNILLNSGNITISSGNIFL